ncbi:MAG: arylsulfatase [Steroidobacteraceae bacterium]
MNFGARAIDFFLIGVVIVQTATAASAAEPAAPSRPNIVVIVADDLGYSDLGSFGGEIRTPNLDALAAEGTRFANFHVAGECSPTRAMLLTGVRSHRTGVGAMHESVPRELEGKPGYLTVLKPEVLTVSSLLQRNGYRTYAVGKWHVGKEPYNLPPARGFDHSIVQGDSGSDNWVPTQRYLALTDRVYWFEDGKPATMPAEYYSSTFYADRAIGYLRNDWAAQRSAASETRPPFFLYLAFQSNHTPLQAPADMVARQRGRYDAGWQVIREQRFRRTQELGLLPPGTQLAAWPGLEDWNALNPTRKAYETRRMEVYAAMAETMDREIGRVRAAIKDLGVDDNTIFVFLSDNGAEPSDPYEYLSGRAWLATQYTRDTDRLGSKGAYATMGRNWAAAAVSPLATHKFFAGEGGLRVPLIIREPVRRSAIHRGFTHVTDVTPTLLEFAGVTHPGKAAGVEPPTGRSLVNVLRDGSASVRAADDTLGYELAGNAALFAGDLKLVRNQPPVGTGDWQLFDIARDPGETRDLRASRPAEFARLLAAYKEYENTDGVRPLPAGYEPRDQVAMNALRRVILPSLWWPALLTIALVVGLWALLGRRNKT